MKILLTSILFSVIVYSVMAQSYEQQMDQAGQAINKKDFCAALATFKQAFTDTAKIGTYDYAYAAVAAANCREEKQVLTWLHQSQKKGLGLRPGEIEFITKDSAFIKLHDSPDWNVLLVRMQQAKEHADNVKLAESQQWVKSGLLRACLSTSKTGLYKQIPTGYALYFQ